MPKKTKQKQKPNKIISKNWIIFFVLVALFILALIFDNQLFVAIKQFRISLNIPLNLNFIESFWFYAIMFVLSLVFILLDNKVKNKKKNIFRYIIGMLIAVVITSLLKVIVARPRPIPSQSHFLLDEKSFPSGHTTFMFSTLSFLKNWLGITWLVLSLIIALERIWQGAHFPSDVIAAIIIGYFVPILLKNAHIFGMLKKSSFSSITTKLINKINLKNNQNHRARRASKNKTKSKK